MRLPSPRFGGPNLTQGLYFYGASGAYDRLLTSKWELEISVDGSRTLSASGKIERGISVTVNSGYALTERWSAELAFVSEFLEPGPVTRNLPEGVSPVCAAPSATFRRKRHHGFDSASVLDGEAPFGQRGNAKLKMSLPAETATYWMPSTA